MHHFGVCHVPGGEGMVGGGETRGDELQAVHEAWSEYWDDDSDSGEALTNGTHAARLRGYWFGVFQTEFDAGDRSLRLLDAACGTGVVARIARQTAEARGMGGLELFLTDFSEPALASAVLKPELSHASCAAADARSLPFADESMDMVVSQFGLEYAGVGGFESAIRLVAPGGRLACVVHKEGGAIANECAGNLTVLSQVDSSGLIEAFLNLFTAIRESAPEPDVQAFAQVAGACGQRINTVLATAMPGAAREHVSQLLRDMQTVMDRIGNYSVAEVRDWAEAQAANIAAYRLRMESMVASAQSEAGLRTITDSLARHGYDSITVAEFPIEDGVFPIAWTLDARRAGA
tara:strand:- start:6403 stop:7446 length:1044 start_codon:yes stop_codon:yes gene_type:complete